MNTEKNKIIAEFMDFKLNPEIAKDIYINSDKKSQMYISQMLYHSDWNWLMEVVNKCFENQLFGSNKLISAITLSFITVDIKVTYNACLDFIKWYNEQKK